LKLTFHLRFESGFRRHILLLTLLTTLIGSCLTAVSCLDALADTQAKPASQGEVLPTWREGKAKQSIIDFVHAVTTPGPEFVKEEERIAVFDNDGTLWCESPFYPQLQFAIDRAKVLVVDKPSLAEIPSVAAAVKGDSQALVATGSKGAIELIGVTHCGMSTQQFDRIASQWIAGAKQPRFNRPYTECVYQPMIELLAYLRQNNFKTYIVSGGGVELMRTFSEKVYGIAPEQVIGSSCKLQFEMVNGKPVIMRLPEIHFIDDKDGKPVGIHEYIGRRPIAAFGNSDGDLAMLQYTCLSEPNKPSLGLIVHHTDAAREYAYDRDSSIGRLDKALDEAKTHGWTVVDMKNDWKKVFAFDGKP